MNKKKSIIIIIICVLVVAIVAVFIIKAMTGHRQIKVEDVKNDVTVIRDDSEEMDAYEGLNLIDKDKVEVDEDSKVVLLIDNDKHVVAQENTVFVIRAAGDKRNGKIKINLLEGESLFTIDNKLPDNSYFEVSTPNATLSVRGTEFEVTYDKENDITTVEVMDGVVRAEYEGDFDDENIKEGESRVITNDEVYEGPIKEGLEAILGGASVDGASDTDVVADSAAQSERDLESFETVAGRREAYSEVVENISEFAASSPRLGKDYVSYDYMYFDYDGDGDKEVVYYLEFEGDDGEYYRDVAFLKYNENSQKVDILGISNNEPNDASFYAEYEGRMARYSWTMKPMESYLYVVNADGPITFVLENSYDEILSDIEAEGLHPLPLYGEWEMLPED